MYHLIKKNWYKKPHEDCPDPLFAAFHIFNSTDKDEAALTKEIARLEGMKGKSMKAEQKAFLFQRLHILGQLSPAGKEEL